MDVSELLAKLRKVKQTGPGRWVACCPAHDDKSPSLSIKQERDGTILLHDFAGCGTCDIVGALGFEMRDLFPEDKTWEGHGEKRHFRINKGFTALDALQCLNYEAGIVLISAHDLAQGKVLSPTELDRLAVAAGRIAEALTVVI